MKTAISIPDQTFREADALAKRLGMSRSELYARAVRRYLEAQRRACVTERLDAVYGDEGSDLDPVLAAMQTASFPREDW
jgi:metal-responsive CopG/Arc/MetJ family transcriptional regulator